MKKQTITYRGHLRENQLPNKFVLKGFQVEPSNI